MIYLWALDPLIASEAAGLAGLVEQIQQAEMVSYFSSRLNISLNCRISKEGSWLAFTLRIFSASTYIFNLCCSSVCANRWSIGWIIKNVNKVLFKLTFFRFRRKVLFCARLKKSETIHIKSEKRAQHREVYITAASFHIEYLKGMCRRSNVSPCAKKYTNPKVRLV